MLNPANKAEAVGCSWIGFKLRRGRREPVLRSRRSKGFEKDGALDMEGLRNVLKLRAQFGRGAATPADPAKYIDLSYYEKAKAGM